jgi:hypothetical protein
MRERQGETAAGNPRRKGRIDMGKHRGQASRGSLSRIVWSALILSATCADAVAQEPVDDRRWTFDAAVYGWLMSVSGTLGLNDLNADIDNSFADTLRDTKSIIPFMVHGEARRDDIGVFLDIVYVNLGYEDVAVGPLRADASSDLAIGEIGGLYRFGRWPLDVAGQSGSWALEGLGGLRYSYIGGEIDIAGQPAVKQSKDWVDPFIGLRVVADLSSAWEVSLRGDIGGFDVGSDFAWQLVGLLSYRFPLWGADAKAVVGYRALSPDFKSGSGSNRFKWDTTLHGPVLGLSFRF